MGTTQAELAERRAAIKRMFPNGGEIKAVAAALGISWHVARRDMLALRLPYPDGREARSGRRKPERNKALLAAVQAAPHRTLQSFADEFGVTRERVRQIIKRYVGAPKPPAGSYSKAARLAAQKAARAEAKRQRIARREARALALLQRRAQGNSVRGIAKDVGLHWAHIYREIEWAEARGLRAQVTEMAS